MEVESEREVEPSIEVGTIDCHPELDSGSLCDKLFFIHAYMLAPAFPRRGSYSVGRSDPPSNSLPAREGGNRTTMNRRID